MTNDPDGAAAASQAASAILVHSADHAWQEQLVPDLQRLVERGKIFGSDVAEIVDSLLVRAGKPQKFGTQVEIRSGEVVILPVRDPNRTEEILCPPFVEASRSRSPLIVLDCKS